jgi:hypothetical protein
MRLFGRLAFALALVPLAPVALLVVTVANGCGSDARATDACRRIESARCERGPQCIPDFGGDVASCQRFYDVQCGRGVQDPVKEPSKKELDDCVAAIRDPASCTAAVDPTSSTQCAFLVANTPPPPPPDTGAPDTAGEAGDAATD